MAGEDEMTGAQPHFSVVERGYDPDEVRSFVAEAADQVARLRARNDELVARLAGVEAGTAERRRAAAARIDQLRVGRERLLESYAVVRRTLAEVQDDLRRADTPDPPDAPPAPPREAPPREAPPAPTMEAPAAPAAFAAPAAPKKPSDAVRSDADESQLQRRDAELDGLVAGMVRRWKRVLQDDHSVLLDRLRRATGPVGPADVLGPYNDQSERYAGAARPFVEQAAAAGVRFASRAVPGPDVSRPDVVAGVAGPVLADVVGAFVEPLRVRVGAVLAERSGDATDVLVDVLASVFRETRALRIEALTIDVLSAAHAEATWRAAPAGSALRWVAEDADGPCPDCDDNVLAGPVARGQAFPTGQLHPPAHRGCRCLLVLDET